MEDSLKELGKAEHIFLYKQFEEVCPYFIAMGMTYEQFWQGDVTMTKAYLKAYKVRQKEQVDMNEWNIWKQGMYIYEALCDVSPVLHAFSKKGTKPLPYSKTPYGYEEYEQKIEEQKEKENNGPTQQEVENERLKAQIFFSNWARSVKKHFNNGNNNKNKNKKEG